MHQLYDTMNDGKDQTSIDKNLCAGSVLYFLSSTTRTSRMVSTIIAYPPASTHKVTTISIISSEKINTTEGMADEILEHLPKIPRDGTVNRKF
jgi:hypothetical protein